MGWSRPCGARSSSRLFHSVVYILACFCQAKIDWFDETLATRLYRPMITPTLCRAARVLLGWRQEELAERSEVGVTTVRQFEGGKTTPHRTTLNAFQSTFEDAGVEFITRDGEAVGVQFRNDG